MLGCESYHFGFRSLLARCSFLVVCCALCVVCCVLCVVCCIFLVVVLQPIEELYASNASLTYTTDPNMATFKCADCMPVQGGFIVIKPLVADYENIINVLVTTEFKKNWGWNRSKSVHYYFLLLFGSCVEKLQGGSGIVKLALCVGFDAPLPS